MSTLRFFFSLLPAQNTNVLQHVGHAFFTAQKLNANVHLYFAHSFFFPFFFLPAQSSLSTSYYMFRTLSFFLNEISSFANMWYRLNRFRQKPLRHTKRLGRISPQKSWSNSVWILINKGSLVWHFHRTSPKRLDAKQLHTLLRSFSTSGCPLWNLKWRWSIGSVTDW